MNIGERMKQVRKSKHISADEVANKLGVSRSTIFRYENGDIEKVPTDILKKVSEAIGTTPAYLMGWDSNNNIVGIYERLNDDRKEKVLNFANSQLNEQNHTYILSGRSTAAGAPIDGDYEDAQQEIIVRNEVPRGADEVVTIAGDSMEPLLKQGSQAFVHYQPTPDTDGQIVIVSIKGDGVTCKRIYREDGKIRLASINEKYEDMVFPAEDVRIIGKVIISQKK